MNSYKRKRKPKLGNRKLTKHLSKYHQSLEHQLCEGLLSDAGGRGYDEGAVDTLYRIKRERDQAFLILALDRLERFAEGRYR